jgi:hypothetical protein
METRIVTYLPVNAPVSVSFTAQFQSGTVPNDQAPQVASTLSKRKATAPPKDSESFPKKRQKRYDAVADVDKFVLPDYTHTQLLHTSRDQAVSAHNNMLKSLDSHFQPPSPDSTIPQTDAERQAAVRILVDAMQDISHADDAGSKAFESRWAPNAPRKYEELDIQITAWEIVVSIISSYDL